MRIEKNTSHGQPNDMGGVSTAGLHHVDTGVVYDQDDFVYQIRPTEKHGHAYDVNQDNWI